MRIRSEKQSGLFDKLIDLNSFALPIMVLIVDSEQWTPTSWI
jgi:hypothetical protein